MKRIVKQTITIGLMLLMMCSMAFAQETEQITTQEQVKVTVMPDSPFYGLKLFFENIQEKLNSNTIQEHQQKRLIELDAMILKQDGISAGKVNERIQNRYSVQTQVQAEKMIQEGFIIDNNLLTELKTQLNIKYAMKYGIMDGKVLAKVDDKNYELTIKDDVVESIMESSGNGVYLASAELSKAEFYGAKDMSTIQVIGLYNQLRNQNRIQVHNMGTLKSMGELDESFQSISNKYQGGK